MLLSHCAAKIIIKVFISFSLKNERSSVQLITIMLMNTLSAISTLRNTDFKLSEIIFLQRRKSLTIALRSHGMLEMRAFIEKVTIIEVLVIHISQRFTPFF